MAARTLTRLELNRALLARQLLLKRKRVSVVAAAHAMGGIQSQEPKDPYVALWSRIAGFKRERLEEAARKRELVRGSYLRATIHTAATDDFVAFRPLLQEVLNRELKTWSHLEGGFTIDALEPAARKLLASEGPLNPKQIAEGLAPKFPKAQPKGLAHRVRTCYPMAMTPTDDRWGYSRPPKYQFADEWLGRPIGGGSLAELLLHGIAAVGPASSADLRTWSSLTGIKPVLEELRPQLKVFKDEQGRELFDLPDAPRPRSDTPAPVRFLPEYDNFFLSHADRSRIGDGKYAHHFDFQKNGRRVRAVLIDGFVSATWSIERAKGKATIAVSVFERHPAETTDEIGSEAEALLRYHEPDAEEFVVNVGRAKG